jgi:hypothetical protein
LHFNNWAHSLHGRPDSESDHGVLADWRIEHPVRKELLESLGSLESSSEMPNVLSVDKDALIRRQKVVLSVSNGVNIGDLSHYEMVAISLEA